MNITKKSTWADTKIIKTYPKLNQDLEADVVIVGAGITGLLNAYVLAQAGNSVVVLEAKRIAQNATVRTTAFITESIDTDMIDMISIYGAAKTRLIVESHRQGRALIESIIEREKIDCQFVDIPHRIFINSIEDRQSLRDEYKATKRFIKSATLHDRNDLGFPQFGYITVPHQAKFDPLRFISGLLKALDAMGVEIYEMTEVTEVTKKSTVTARAGTRSVKARYAIMATYGMFGNSFKTFAKKGVYISYMYELRIPTGLFEEGTYEDFENPYHYFRVDKAGKNYDRMIIGGEDNREEIEFGKQKNFDALSDYVKRIMGENKYDIVKKWRGPILEPSDGLPLIGKVQPNHLVASAFSGNGMTYAAVSAIMFRDIIAGKSNPWIELYDPARIPSVKRLWTKAKDYIEEFANAALKNTFR